MYEPRETAVYPRVCRTFWLYFGGMYVFQYYLISVDYFNNELTVFNSHLKNLFCEPLSMVQQIERGRSDVPLLKLAQKNFDLKDLQPEKYRKWFVSCPLKGKTN